MLDSSDATNDLWRIGNVTIHTVAAEPQQNDENRQEQGTGQSDDYPHPRVV